MTNAILSWTVSNIVLAGLLAVLAFVVSRLWRNPQVAHALWLLVLIKLVTPPIVSIENPWPKAIDNKPAPVPQTAAAKPSPVLDLEKEMPAPEITRQPLPSSPDTVVEIAPIEDVPAPANLPKPEPMAQPTKAFSSTPMDYSGWIIAAWGFGAIAFSGLVWVRCLRFRRLLKSTFPAEENIQAETFRLSERMGLTRTPEVSFVDAAIPPLVWGVCRRPRILLPRKLFQDLNLEQQQTVLAHELAHIRRGDHRLRWIEVSVRLLFWWYPLVWWAGREMRRAEEECCDAWVIWTLPESRQAYGQALCQTIEFLSDAEFRVPSAVGTTMGTHFLKRRIQMIVKQNIPHRMSWRSRSAVVLLAAIALPLAAQTREPDSSKPEPPKNTPILPAEIPTEQTKPKLEPAPPTNIEPAKPAADSQKESTGQEPQPTAIEGKGKEQVHALLLPFDDLHISSQHPGVVQNVPVREGDHVKKGDALLEIKNTELENRLKEVEGDLQIQKEVVAAAEVSVRLARSELKRTSITFESVSTLHKKHVVSDEEFHIKQAALEEAKLNVEKSELDAKAAQVQLSVLETRVKSAAQILEELAIKSPVDGTVVEFYSEPGELIKAGDAICRVVSFDILKIESYVRDPRGLLGRDVEVRLKGQTVSAKISFVSPIAEPVRGSFRIRCQFPNLGPDKKPIAYPGQEATILIPSK